ncbi:MAG: ATP-binding protein, partial [Ignavibacteria bacterium]|nr:ATP-binding protein [Ignavibacteria bacterium]
MNRKELISLIEEGENIQCEFKRQFTTPEKNAKEMIAFANTKGGYILFGVDDDKTVVGVESEKSEAEMIKDAVINYCEPPFDYKIN